MRCLMIFQRMGPGRWVFRFATPAHPDREALHGVHKWQYGIVGQNVVPVIVMRLTAVRAGRGIAVVSDRRVRVMPIRVTDVPRRVPGAVGPKDVRVTVTPIIVARAAGGRAAGPGQDVQVTRHQIDNAGGI